MPIDAVLGATCSAVAHWHNFYLQMRLTFLPLDIHGELQNHRSNSEQRTLTHAKVRTVQSIGGDPESGRG